MRLWIPKVTPLGVMANPCVYNMASLGITITLWVCTGIIVSLSDGAKLHSQIRIQKRTVSGCIEVSLVSASASTKEVYVEEFEREIYPSSEWRQFVAIPGCLSYTSEWLFCVKQVCYMRQRKGYCMPGTRTRSPTHPLPLTCTHILRSCYHVRESYTYNRGKSTQREKPVTDKVGHIYARSGHSSALNRPCFEFDP